MSKLDEITNIDELISLMLSSPKCLDSACHDVLLVDSLFPTLGDEFKTGGMEIPQDKLKNFLETLNYGSLGLDKDRVYQQLKDLNRTSVSSIISTIVEMIPQEIKTQVAADHIKQLWFHKNCGDDLQKFKNCLAPDYWGF